ncbi:hypothetical protein FQA39_LY15964 [Lamprigera yunnana]|nr:hypothetical protein FQA39_LY15964 [Lamprigera yunnana]
MRNYLRQSSTTNIHQDAEEAEKGSEELKNRRVLMTKNNKVNELTTHRSTQAVEKQRPSYNLCHLQHLGEMVDKKEHHLFDKGSGLTSKYTPKYTRPYKVIVEREKIATKAKIGRYDVQTCTITHCSHAEEKISTEEKASTCDPKPQFELISTMAPFKMRKTLTDGLRRPVKMHLWGSSRYRVSGRSEETPPKVPLSAMNRRKTTPLVKEKITSDLVAELERLQVTEPPRPPIDSPLCNKTFPHVAKPLKLTRRQKSNLRQVLVVTRPTTFIRIRRTDAVELGMLAAGDLQQKIPFEVLTGIAANPFEIQGVEDILFGCVKIIPYRVV